MVCIRAPDVSDIKVIKNMAIFSAGKIGSDIVQTTNSLAHIGAGPDLVSDE